MIKFLLRRCSIYHYAIFTKKKVSPSQDRFNELNEAFENYKKNKFGKIARPSSSQDNYVNQSEVKKQHKETLKSIDAFSKEYKFNRNFDVDRFIKLISQVSYTYDNKTIVASQQFQTLITEIAEVCSEFIYFFKLSYQFKDTRQMCLFMNFCNMHDVDLPVWVNFSQYIRNYYKQLSNDDKILVLSSTNIHNKDEFLVFFELFESFFLEELKKDNVDLRMLFRVLEVYRAYDQGTETFYFTIKSFIIQNIAEMKLPDLIQLLMYFALNPRETHEDKKELLHNIMLHLFKTMKFLNNKELIQVFYAYVKTGLGTPVLYGLISERMKLVINEMSLGEIETLLVIAANEDTQKIEIFAHVEAVLKPRIRETSSKDLVQITLLFVENGLGSKEFISKLENHIIPSMYTVPIDELSDLIWALVNTRSMTNLFWVEKAAVAVSERIGEMTIKHFAQMVWLTSDYFKLLKKPQESKLIDMYESIEKQLIIQLENYEKLTLKECSLVLSAYVQNIPIPLYALQLMYDFLIGHPELDQLDAWDLSTIVWGYSYIEGYDEKELENLMKVLYPHVLDKMEEMKLYEMLIAVRAYVVTKTEEQLLIEKGIEKCLYWVDLMNSLDQVYLGIYVFCNTKFKNLQNQGLLLKKLYERAQRLKALADQQGAQGKQLADIEKEARTYQVREEVNRIKSST